MMAGSPVLLCALFLVSIPTAPVSAVSSGNSPPLIDPFAGISSDHFRPLEPGVPFTLECMSSTVPVPTLAWFRDGVPLEGETGVALKFLPSNSVPGRYHCEATNELGLAKSAVVLVSPVRPKHPEYQVPPLFTSQPQVEIQQLESRVVFSCSATGSPEPAIAWTRNGIPLPAFADQEHLVIASFSEKDVANYACNASNVAGYAYKMAVLNILSQRPFFSEYPSGTRTVALGQEVFLRCAAKGYPKPAISWKFNGSPLDVERDPNLGLAERGDLVIRRVGDAHAGEYACEAKNDQGDVTSSGKLAVVSTTTIDKGPVDTVGRIRSRVRFDCSVVWDPNFNLSILWKKDNVDIEPGTPRFTVEEDAASKTLVISDLEFGDKGTYTCVASTPQGSTTKSGTLTVEGIPPKLIEGPVDAAITEGASIRLPCNVESDPIAEHTWYKNITRITPEDHPNMRINEVDNSLTITDAKESDSDKYVCGAISAYGRATGSAFIDVRKATNVTSQPQSQIFVEGQNYTLVCAFEVDPRLEDRVNVTWTKDGNAIDDNEKFSVDENNTLRVSEVTAEEMGEYACTVTTPVDEVVVKASIYSNEFSLWWLILLLVILLLCILVLLVCLVCAVRRRSRRKGRYGVKDVTDGNIFSSNGHNKHNKSDIMYSIDEEGDGMMEDLLEGSKKKPILKAKSKQQLKDLGGGSQTSLLDDVSLEKGMKEDGSFRGIYAELAPEA